MEWYLCFVAASVPGDSFFSQIKRACLFSYKEDRRECYDKGEEELVCIYVLDCAVDTRTDAALQWQHKREKDGRNRRPGGQNKRAAGQNGKRQGRTSWIAAKIMDFKRKQFVERLTKKLGSRPQLYFACDKNERPETVYALCVSRFLDHIRYEKNTVIGLIDGNLINYKIWIGLLRKKLDRINALMIVSDRPESFVELYRDAWEEQGLVITRTGNYKELAFCDYVIDCSEDVWPDKIFFRKNCHYLMLSGLRRKKKLLFLQNRHIRISDCGDYLDRAFQYKV